MREGGPVSRGSRVSGGGRPVTMLLALLVASVCSALVGACAVLPFSFGDTQASARALAIQPDGKLILAGTAGIGNRIAFALARYLPDGSLDPTFGTGGKVTTHFRGSPSVASSGSFAGAFARALAVQPDGKLVAAGVASIGGLMSVRLDSALARYFPDGNLDPAFGVEETVTTQFGGSNYNVPTLALQPDGKLVVAGDALVGDRFVFALARYLPDGSLDPTFGKGGKVTTDFSESRSFSSARAIAVQPDGKLVAAGAEDIGDRPAFALGRYLPNGSMDPAFGVGGKVTTDFGVGTP